MLGLLGRVVPWMAEKRGSRKLPSRKNVWKIRWDRIKYRKYATNKGRTNTRSRNLSLVRSI